MKVIVTKECIDNAIRKDSHHCMIADAVHAADPNAKYVKVDVQSIQWSNMEKGERYTALTPKLAQLNILRWDKGNDVKPFSFTVHAAIVKPVGWKAHHPNSSRKGKKYRVTGKRRPYKTVPQREFGLQMFIGD